MNIAAKLKLPDNVRELLSDSVFAAYATDEADVVARKKLATLKPTDLFSQPIRDMNLAKWCLSGLGLLHHCLDESHEISQSIHTSEGSYWHAIMHRLEGDFSNAKYWYRNAGNHPIDAEIETMTGESWNPSKFVDRCQREIRSGNLSEAAKVIAVAEWTALFEYCYQNAIEVENTEVP